MTIKVTIEEVISQEFEVDVNETDDIYDQIRSMYKQGKLVVEDPTLILAQALINDGEESDWCNLHV